MHILAFHNDKTNLKVALLKKEGKSAQIELLQTFDLLDVKPFDILKESLNQKRFQTVTGISASDLLLREVSLPLKNKRAINKALPFQIESLVPFPLEEAIIHSQSLKAVPHHISLFIVKKNQLEHHLDTFKALSITPDRVASTPSALYRYAQFAAPGQPDLIVFNIGEEKSSYIAISSNRLILSQTVSIGKMSPPQQFQTELQRVSAYLSQKVSCKQILLTGELTSELIIRIKNSFSESFSFIEGKNSDYAIPIGLCLEEKENGVQFLAGSFEPTHKKTRVKKLMRSCIAASLATSLVLFFGGTHLVRSKEKALFHRLDLDATKESNLASAIAKWDKNTKNTKTPPLFALNVPLVSDILAWISIQPQTEGIDIQRISYELIQYPQLGKEKEPYAAHVTLSFRASTPRHAQAFHSLLMSQESLATSLKWTNNEDLYTASFELKKGET